ncbi:hypothetical protein GCM10017779_61760 [Streptomyces capillispiralis]|nr:hypothetical protein GCM10017779_61760 [Streptomyces capillispiralis]
MSWPLPVGTSLGGVGIALSGSYALTLVPLDTPQSPPCHRGRKVGAGPRHPPLLALASVSLYMPFSLRVALDQDHLPSQVGTVGGITLGLTVSIGGPASPSSAASPTPRPCTPRRRRSS